MPPRGVVAIQSCILRTSHSHARIPEGWLGPVRILRLNLHSISSQFCLGISRNEILGDQTNSAHSRPPIFSTKVDLIRYLGPHCNPSPRLPLWTPTCWTIWPRMRALRSLCKSLVVLSANVICIASTKFTGFVPLSLLFFDLHVVKQAPQRRSRN